MSTDDIAQAVLDALGGSANILTNTVCMTRLRVTLNDPSSVDYDALNSVQNVLGISTRGRNGIEVVFGPRVIDTVYHAFLRHSGIPAGTDALFPMSRPNSNMRVQINPAKSTTPAKRPKPTSQKAAGSALDDHDMGILQGLLEDNDSAAAPTTSLSSSKPTVIQHASPVSPPEPFSSHTERRPALLVVNGPNINMMGISDSEDDEQDYPSMLALCKKAAAESGFVRCDCYQSNHEGDLIDIVQDAYALYDAIVINPGAYSHTSIALLDALIVAEVPAVEVHVIDPMELDEFRRVSYTRQACIDYIVGQGIEGYRQAIQTLAHHLGI